MKPAPLKAPMFKVCRGDTVRHSVGIYPFTVSSEHSVKYGRGF